MRSPIEIKDENWSTEKFLQFYAKREKNERKNKNKYGAIRHRCKQDHIHQSIGEAAVCNELEIRKSFAKSDVAFYKSQVKFILKVKGKFVANHYVDFLVEYKDGRKEILEVKSTGTVTALWKLKKALTEILYPKIPYKMRWI